MTSQCDHHQCTCSPLKSKTSDTKGRGMAEDEAGHSVHPAQGQLQNGHGINTKNQTSAFLTLS